MLKRLMLPLVGLLTLAGCTDRAPALPTAARASLADGAPVVLEVKFREALVVRGEGGEVASDVGASLDPVRSVLDGYGLWEIHPLVQTSRAELDEMAQAALDRTGQAPPDLASWYQVVLPAGASADEAAARLRALREVEYAYPMPAPAPPPALSAFTTPDFTSYQTYFGPAPAGTDAAWARSLPGAAGDGVTIVDLEYDWYFAHEDLGLSPSILIAGEPYTYYGSDHGTAVLGELVARDNGFGVTGGVPNATIRVASTVFAGQSYRPADAIVAATAAVSPGDVLLLEAQTWGPNGYYVPLEYIQSVYEATLAATMAGRIVVAAAGNGGENLDGPEFLGTFNRSVRNSGAIIVGAGDSSHARLYFSSYGSRVDVHAWGEGVATTGYGNLFGTGLGNAYTAGFNGTSSASPIVTAAVASVQGRRKALGLPVLTAAEMVQLLRATGTPQTGDTTQNIGPFPNLRAALVVPTGPVAPASLSATALSGTAVALAWPAGSRHTRYALQRRQRSAADSVWGAWQAIASPAAAAAAFNDTGRTPGTAYQYRIAACDAAQCSGWTLSPVVTTLSAPAAPAALVGAPASPTTIQLSWTDVSTTETRFEMYRRERPAGGAWGGWVLVTTRPANTTVVTDGGRVAGTAYLYRVNACNAVGCSAGAQSPTIVMPVAPAPVTTVRATALSTSRSQVQWTDASGNETRFEVQRRLRGLDGVWGPQVQLGSARANAVSFADSTALSGRYYLYSVRACNGVACSAWAVSQTLVMPAVPAAPTAFRVASATAAGVQLAWVDSSSNETSFTLQRRTRNTEGVYGAWVHVANPPRNATGFRDTTVAPGGRYYYRLNACDGTVCSTWAAPIGVAVPAS